MSQRPVTINLPSALIHDLRRIAAERDEAPGDMIRAMLLREVARHGRTGVRDPVDDPIIAPLYRRLAAEVAAATSWADLALRLGRHGYTLGRSAAGLGVCGADGVLSCGMSELGFTQAELTRRFAAPMPGRFGRMARLRVGPPAGQHAPPPRVIAPEP